MKVTGLLLITLGVATLAQAAHQNYHLQCTEKEMGIRWPSYKSNSEYFVCHNRGVRPMIVPCKAGEVFTFVLQMCTSPSRYIPAPAIEILPTDSPLVAHTHHNFNHHQSIKPLDNTNVPQPPIYDHHHQHSGSQMVPQSPPVVTFDAPKPPTMPGVEHNKESEEHKIPEQVPHVPVKPHKPAARPPMPPTPAPTPPVMAGETVKKPQASHPKKPTVDKKKPLAKPSKSDDKKPTTTSTKAEKKAPKKAPKKPPTPVKKSPKAPTKA